jgi:hypothetical protein
MSEKKIFRESEVTSKKDKSTWLIIHDNVYDVTKFLEEVSILRCTWKNEADVHEHEWSKSRTVTPSFSVLQHIVLNQRSVAQTFI